MYARNCDVSKGSNISDTMKLYCCNTGFRRTELLMKEFDVPGNVIRPSPLHRCCNICERECTCSECDWSDLSLWNLRLLKLKHLKMKP